MKRRSFLLAAGMAPQFRMIAETIQRGDIGDVNFVRISDHRGDSLRDMQQMMGVSAPLMMSVSGCSAQYEYADFVAVCEPADMGTERIAFYGTGATIIASADGWAVFPDTYKASS